MKRKPAHGHGGPLEGNLCNWQMWKEAKALKRQGPPRQPVASEKVICGKKKISFCAEAGKKASGTVAQKKERPGLGREGRRTGGDNPQKKSPGLQKAGQTSSNKRGGFCRLNKGRMNPMQRPQKFRNGRRGGGPGQKQGTGKEVVTVGPRQTAHVRKRVTKEERGRGWSR